VYPLADNPVWDLSNVKKEWTVEVGFSLKLGVQDYGLSVGLDVKVRRERGLSLTFDLPGAQDYRLRKVAVGDGLNWG